MSATQGFLVVLKTPETYGVAGRKRYRGVDRKPSYRLANQEPIESEVGAMERYVFGDVCDEESGLIPSYAVARELLAQFHNSPREFELLWCRVIPIEEDDTQKPPYDRPGKQLGFDLAGLGGDFWSIVADFPVDDPRFTRFLGKLNDRGLFSAAADARAYLNEYQRLQLHDHDIPFQVLEVRLV